MTTLMTLSLGQLLTYGSAVAIVSVLVCVIAFAIEDSVVDDDLPCVMVLDQWGMHCVTHQVRSAGYGLCPKRRVR